MSVSPLGVRGIERLLSDHISTGLYGDNGSNPVGHGSGVKGSFFSQAVRNRLDGTRPIPARLLIGRSEPENGHDEVVRLARPGEIRSR